jgi:hypothetical protein
MKPAPAPAKTQNPPEHKQFRWEAITAISTLVLALATLFVLVFTWRQINQFHEAERVHQLVEQRRWFNSSEFRQVRRSLAMKRLGADNKLATLNLKEPPQEMYEVLNFFEELGLLEKEGYLDPEDVWDELSYYAFNINEDAKPLLENERRDDQYSYRYFEALIATLQTIEAEKRGKACHPSEDDLVDFYKYAQKLSGGTPTVKPVP